MFSFAKVFSLVSTVNLMVFATVALVFTATFCSNLIVLPDFTLSTAACRVGYTFSPIDAAGTEITNGLKPLVVKVSKCLPLCSVTVPV